MIRTCTDPRPIRFLLWFLILTAGLLHAQERVVDFRYAPARHLNIISLPDDWLKTLVSETGELAYDFGPGPYGRPLTSIGITVRGPELPVRRQILSDAKVPIVQTTFGATSDAMEVQTFALVPSRQESGISAPYATPVTRLGGLSGCPAWSSPGEGFDPAFRDVAWGTNRPILYRVKVVQGSSHRVAVGVCESYKSRPGSRFLELHVEGSRSRVVDPLSEGIKNRPYVFLFDGRDENGDGLLTIEAHAAPQSPDPNVLMNAFWVFPPNTVLDADSVAQGALNALAEVRYVCGREAEAYAPAPRIDGMAATIAEQSLQPEIRVRTHRRLSYDSTTGILLDNGMPFVVSRPRALAAHVDENGWILELPVNCRRVELIVVHGSRGRDVWTSVPDLQTEMQRATTFWQSEASLPYHRITVPDSGIQYVLDASIRTLYQVREIVDGRLQFQPGPTVYRGLWAGDVVLSGIPVAMLGDTAGMRRFIETTLRYQLPDGRIRVMVPYNTLAETPFVLSAMCLYASFSGDDRWLEQSWDALSRGIAWIEHQRNETLKDLTSGFAGLMPPSFVDGGLMKPTADYGTAWWSLVALEKAIDAAERLGKKADAGRWQRLYASFLTSLRAAMARDIRTTTAGRPYLPISVADTSGNTSPQRGQYVFLLALRNGDFFQTNDSITAEVVRANMGMLDESTSEGLIVGSGWMTDGVWGWLGGIHGIAHNLLGNAARAGDLMYAYANHASPLGTWVEEQQPHSIGKGTSGDASDAEASAVFIQLVRDILVVERRNSLAFLQSVPEEWLTAGKRISMNSVLTQYGPVSLSVEITNHSSRAHISVVTPPIKDPRPAPLLFLEGFRRRGFASLDGTPLPEFMTLKWGSTSTFQFVRLEQ